MKWKQKKGRIILVTAILIALVATGGYYLSKQTAAKAEVPVAVEATVEKSDLTIGFESDGTAAIPTTELAFEVNGTLMEVLVKAGDKVKAGQVLATLDNTELKRARDLASLAYEKAKLTYSSKGESQSQTLQSDSDKVTGLKSAMEALKKDYARILAVSDYYAQSEIDAKKQALDDAIRAYELAAGQLKVTSASKTTLALEKVNVDTSKLQLEAAEADLTHTVLTAPTDGIILQVNGEVGDKVDATGIVVFTASEAYEVDTTVSEQDVPLVKVGQSVEVIFDAIGNKVHEGVVTELATLPTVNSSGVVSYAAVIRLKAGYEDIRVGMTATATIIQKQEKDVLIIPNKAVTMENGKQTVKVKKSDGNTEVRTIKTGLTDGRNVAVASGLEQGEVVVYETSKTTRTTSRTE